jgi:serine/threonine protein kinase
MPDDSKELPSFEVGDLIAGRYRLLRILGVGGQSQVWLAEDTQLRRSVAVKLLRADRASRPGAWERFLLEAQITARLNHPGVPSVHDLGFLEQGLPYIVMRVVEGRSLKDILADLWTTGGRPGLPCLDKLGQLLGIFEQVCQTVGYAHSQGYIHRDLKPSNIMVGAHGEVQVMDWGLAKCFQFRLSNGETVPAASAVEETVQFDGMSSEETSDWGSAIRTETGTVLGTPSYMPPEQAAGEVDKLDPRSDVFGLGAILCEILTGQPPYVSTTAHEVRLQACRWQIQPALQRLAQAPVSPEWVELCKKCLNFAPEERFSDAEVLARIVAQLRQAAEERAQRAERERTEAAIREVEERKRRRQSLIWSLAVILVLGLSTVLVGVAWQRARESARAEHQARLEAQQRQEQAEYHRLRAEQALLAEQQARHAEQLARHQERRAREEVLRVLRDLTDDTLESFVLRAAQWNEQDQAFLERLAQHFQALARVHGEDPASCSLRAEGYLRLSILNYRLKQLAAAETYLRSAAHEWESLLRQDSGNRNYALGLSRVWLVLGYVYRAQYRFHEALETHLRCWKLRQSLVQTEPLSPELLDAWAYSCQAVGQLLDIQGKPQLAELAFLDGIDACERHLAQQPNATGATRRYFHLLVELSERFLETGRFIEAEHLAQTARNLAQRLLANQPNNPLAQSNLAEAEILLARCWQRLGRPTDADRAFANSVAIYRRLAAEFPAAPRYQDSLASALLRYSSWHRQNGNTRQSDALLDEALTIRQKLAQHFPHLPEYARELASGYALKGNRLASARRYKEAEDFFRRSHQIYQELANRFPSWPTVQEDLARAEERLGRILAAQQKPTAALLHLQRAQELVTALYQRLPYEVNYRHWLGYLHTLQAEQFLESRSDLASIREQLDAAQRLLESALDAQPRDRLYRQDYRRYLSTLVVYQAAGHQVESACSTAQRLAALGFDPSEDAYAAATALANAITWLASHSSPDTTVDDMLERLGATAVAIVQQAWKKLENAPAERAQFLRRLRTATRLQPIRSRADFQEFFQLASQSDS